MNKPIAEQLVADVVESMWRRRRRPILGSQLKIALVNEARARSANFDERELGYDSFAQFMADVRSVTVEFRQGTDFTVMPLNAEPAAATGGTHPEEWVRTDVWKTFVAFPVEGQLRGYDPVSGRVYWGPPEAAPANLIPIRPIPIETQLTWRRAFAERQAEPLKSAITAALDGAHPFRDSNALLRQHEPLQEEWRPFWLSLVRAQIEQWAKDNHLPKEHWLAKPVTPSEDAETRMQLYALFDRIPITDLLKLEVPLGWLVRSKNPHS